MKLPAKHSVERTQLCIILFYIVSITILVTSLIRDFDAVFFFDYLTMFIVSMALVFNSYIYLFSKGCIQLLVEYIKGHPIENVIVKTRRKDSGIIKKYTVSSHRFNYTDFIRTRSVSSITFMIVDKNNFINIFKNVDDYFMYESNIVVAIQDDNRINKELFSSSDFTIQVTDVKLETKLRLKE